MTTDKLFEEICEYAKGYGMVVAGPDKPKNKSVNAVIRKNYGKNKEKDEDGENKEQSGSDYFGFIREHNGSSGKYEDLSLVFFPQSQGEEIVSCIVALGVGLNGLPNDLTIASLPGTRRLFNRLGGTQNVDIDPNKCFFKNDFTDIVTDVVTDYITYVNNELDESQPQVNKISDKYKNYLLAGYILTKDDFGREKYKKISKMWLAAYAEFRGWASNNKQRNKVKEDLPPVKDKIIESLIDAKNNSESIEQILYRDRFIVLQGAPGTGKTHTALKIWDNCFDDENRFFEQFHAETTYSDFVYGIRPKLKENEIGYESHRGTLLRAIKKANELEVKFRIARDSNENVKPYRVLLVIDEINRANLSNVLGPVFFLFEKNRKQSNVKINFGDNIIDHLPENLFVIATMNTADRSLAVVDFALRRRFTWITLRPHKIENKELGKDQVFMEDDFNSFNEFFEKYACDEELNLQPGQSYFIVNKYDEAEKQIAEMDCRLKYELMPLIKEYLNEGYLSNAKNVFYNFFFKRIGELIYE